MHLIAEKLDKNARLDRLRYVRADGSETSCHMPRQGTLPHDLIHYVIESQLDLRDGFTGIVAQGATAAFGMELAHGLSGKMAGTEAVQVEAMVEALQTQLWSGQFDMDDFLEGVRTACLARNQPTFDFSGINVRSLLFDEAVRLLAAWTSVPFHGSLTLEFP